MRFAIAILFLAWFVFTGREAYAHQTFPVASWTCIHNGDEEQAYAWFEIVLLPVFEAQGGVAPLWDVDEQYECNFPWGSLQIEVVEYNSPGDAGMCGLAHAWGLEVAVDGRSVFSAPSASARDCFEPDFAPFFGTVRADVHILEICKKINAGAHDADFTQTYECSWRWDRDLRSPSP